MFDKKAIVTSPADLMKGFGAGFIIAAILMYLIAKGIIPIFQGLFK